MAAGSIVIRVDNWTWREMANRWLQSRKDDAEDLRALASFLRLLTLRQWIKGGTVALFWLVTIAGDIFWFSLFVNWEAFLGWVGIEPCSITNSTRLMAAGLFLLNLLLQLSCWFIWRKVARDRRFLATIMMLLGCAVVAFLNFLMIKSIV